MCASGKYGCDGERACSTASTAFMSSGITSRYITLHHITSRYITRHHITSHFVLTRARVRAGGWPNEGNCGHGHQQFQVLHGLQGSPHGGG